MSVQYTGGNCAGGLPGVVRVDPLTYLPSILTTLPGESPFVRYDRHRDRLFVAGLLTINGHGQSIPVTSSQGLVVKDVAPTNNGIVYLDVNGYLEFLDAADNRFPVLDQTTSLPYHLGGGTGTLIVYSETTNSLHQLTYDGPHSACLPSQASLTALKRIDLSADGTVVVQTHAMIPVSNACGAHFWSLDRGPGGGLFIAESAAGFWQSYTAHPTSLGYTVTSFASWSGAYRGFTVSAYSEVRKAAIVHGAEIGGSQNQIWLFRDGTSGLGARKYQDGYPVTCPYSGPFDIEIIR